MLILYPPQPFPELNPNQTVVLAAGQHQGPWVIATPGVRLLARPGAVLDGGGEGSALTLMAPNITVEGLEVQNVGLNADFFEPDAAVTMLGCAGCVVSGLRAKGVTAGLRLDKSHGARVEGARLYGLGTAPGLQTFRSDRVTLQNNRVRGFLDNLYVEFGEGVVVKDNQVSQAERYGLHLMFTFQALVVGNHSQGNRVGSAIMHGAENQVNDNTFFAEVGPLRYGLLLQEEWQAQVEGNLFVGNTLGLASLDSRDTLLKDNRFQGNGTALLFARDADLNTLVAQQNTFVGNLHDLAVDDPQARVRLQGNAFDRASPLPIPHLPSSSFALLAARQPALSLFSLSPAMLLWEGAEAQVPGLRLLSLADQEARPAPQDRPALVLPLLAGALLIILGGLWLRW